MYPQNTSFHFLAKILRHFQIEQHTLYGFVLPGQSVTFSYQPIHLLLVPTLRKTKENVEILREIAIILKLWKFQSSSVTQIFEVKIGESNICHFKTLRSSDDRRLFFMNFSTFSRLKFINLTRFRAAKIAKNSNSFHVKI